MKRMKNIKVWGTALAVVFAFSAVAVANASAASFEASKTGNLKGKALNTQIFTTNGGEVKCTTAATTGSVTELVASHQKVKVQYSGCTAFTFASVSITPAEYDLHANGEVDILNTITITVSPPLLPKCTVTVGPQTGLKAVSYKNNSGKIIEESAVTGITYTSSGGACGSSGSNGTYSGNNEVELEGGTLKFIP